MLSPKRTKYRKAHKGRIHGMAKGGTRLNFGAYGLKAVAPDRCNIRVVDENLGPLAPAQAFGRTCGEILSGIILMIGYIMAAFDERKQSLHDKMAGTLHIYAS